jgi:hypothetical protein
LSGGSIAAIVASIVGVAALVGVAAVVIAARRRREASFLEINAASNAV